MTPLVMPPVVAGTGLLLTLGRKGLLGAKLDALGLSISFTSLAAVLAAAYLATRPRKPRRRNTVELATLPTLSPLPYVEVF